MNTMTRAVLLGATALVAAGCASVSEGPKPLAATGEDALTRSASVGREKYQFAPLPPAEIISQDLGPQSSQPMDEVLAEAEAEFQAAAEARSRGDEEAAYEHYSRMMERLLDANVDPATFYRLREQTTQAPDAQPSIPLDQQLEPSATVNVRVKAEIEAIQRVYPRSFQAGLDRSYRYLPYIRQKFAEAGLPDDLVWLAMVESQFTPRINSPAGAGGMWQFMKGTGRNYGLRTDWYVDDRYDWRKATDAAVRHLSDLYTNFDGNWPLAITAYNMGEGGLARAIKTAGGEEDIWRLIDSRAASRRIAQETKRYYAKLLATIIVAKNPEQYGFEQRPQAAEEIAPLKVKGFYSLAEIEKQAGIERETLAKLNPQLLRGYTPPARETILAVPAGHDARVATVLASMPEMRPGTHQVRQGETLSKIAAIYHVPVSELQSVNRIKSAKSLRAGQQLIIPGGVTADDDTQIVTASAPKTNYTVRSGDSLSKIADKHRVSVKELQQWNRLGNSTDIRAGQRLLVASVNGSAPERVEDSTAPRETVAASTETLRYTVKKGDYPDKIARAHDVKVNDLLAWNNLNARSTIRVGQTLKIVKTVKPSPAPERTQVASAVKSQPSPTVPSANVSNAATHVVKRGETASAIARKHGIRVADLLAWNDLSSRSVLQIGDTLVVRPPAATTVAASSGSAPAEAAGSVRYIHAVAPGERAGDIAEQYDVSIETLYQWNGWDRTPNLGAGDEVVIFRPAPPSQD